MDEFRQELKEELESLRKEIKREVADAVAGPSKGSIHVEIEGDQLGQTEPSAVVVKDLVKLIRDNVRSSLAEKGERAVDDLVKDMPEDQAAKLLTSLANNQRIKIAKMLYISNQTFSEIKAALQVEAPTVSFHLKSLTGLGLVVPGEEGGYQLTKRGRMLVRTLALMNEALGGGSVD